VVAGSRGTETWSARHLRMRRFRCDGQRSMQLVHEVYARSLIESSLQKGDAALFESASEKELRPLFCSRQRSLQ
jgi:hypothetical protein